MEKQDQTQRLTEQPKPETKKDWHEPAIIYERPLEVHADGPPNFDDPYGYLGALNASANIGGGGICT
ncbi:MAG: hypothetical protein J5I90_16405 [Caldilineales bacterium]|nr:hypothetical protein [Caldilineales bacterium]